MHNYPAIILFFRIFGISSSFVGELSHLWSPLPMLLLAIPSLSTAASVLGLPETRGKGLPETFEEAIELELQDSSQPVNPLHKYDNHGYQPLN